MTQTSPRDAKHVSLLWAGPEHASEIAALHASLFDPPWDAASIRSLLDHPASTAFIVLVGNGKQAAGFILGQLAADAAEILSIGVAEQWQRKGLGRRLVEGLARAAARADARRLYLEVADDNAAALALYRRLGFAEVGRRPKYYHRKGGAAADALTLELKL
jgi:ribosomal-protein-alanine N-acetyltransferase